MKWETYQDVKVFRELYEELEITFLGREANNSPFAGHYLNLAKTYLLEMERMELGNRRDILDHGLSFLVRAERLINNI